MTDQPTAYPLAWPPEWPRTTGYVPGATMPFRSNGRWISVSGALRRLFEELRLMYVDEDDVIVSTNLKVRRADGLPRSDQGQPSDDGVAVYFVRDDKPQCIAVDRYEGVAQNIAGCAAVIKALRDLERHGSTLMERAFAGFTALPSPVMVSDAPWRHVLCVGNETDAAKIEKAYKMLRSQEHPDRGGDANRFDRINRAWEAAKQELGL